MTELIYIGLIGEGTEVWRPVHASRLGDNIYLLPDVSPPCEHWAFAPGSAVICERRCISAEFVLVAMRSVNNFPNTKVSEGLGERDVEYLISLMAWEDSFIYETQAEFCRFNESPSTLSQLVQRVLPIIERLLSTGFIRLSRTTFDGRNSTSWHSVELPAEIKSAAAWSPPVDFAETKHWQLVHTGQHKEGHALHAVTPERAHYLKYKKSQHQT